MGPKRPTLSYYGVQGLVDFINSFTACPTRAHYNYDRLFQGHSKGVYWAFK